MLPPDPVADDPDELLDLLDGLILAGGADVDPAPTAPSRIRDDGTVPERDRSSWRSRGGAGARHAGARRLPRHADA